MTDEVIKDDGKFNKELYRKRREHGVRGQIGYANVHRVVQVKNGEERVPIGYRKPRKSKK